MPSAVSQASDFEPVRPLGQRELEPGDRVLGGVAQRPAMAEQDRPIARQPAAHVASWPPSTGITVPEM